MNTYSPFNLNDEGHQEEILTSTFGLIPQSKRITKAEKKFQKPSAYEDDICRAPKATAGRKGAKYDTFDSDEQENLMAMLQKEVGGYNNEEDWQNAFIYMPAKQYRPILAAVIPRLRPNFKSADKNQMNQMWKKVKNLVVKKSQGQSEKRGEPIILDHELPYFKQQLMNIIRTLKDKNFEDFRQKLLPVIEEIRTRGGRPFNSNVFKKHKWSEFVNDVNNADIKAAWKKLPRASNNNSSDADADEEEQFNTFDSVENTTMASSHEMYMNYLETPVEAVVDNNLPIDSDQTDFPTFEDGFGCVTDVAAFLSSQSQEVENNFGFVYEVPILEGCPGYGNVHQVDQFFNFGNKLENEKVLLEDDNNYKQGVFEDMRNGSYVWGC